MAQLVAITWFPHSGCRWLNRSLLGNHSNIKTTELFLPFLTHSTDMILNLDRTSQVHKSRSMPDLKNEFDLVRESVNYGRSEGIKKYLELKMVGINEQEVLVGALSPGAPEPLLPDLESVVNVFPSIKIIHLVRNPIDCFLSMKSRLEMDGSIEKIGSLWSAYNSYLRRFGNKNTENYYMLKYEDLKADPTKELEGLCSWIGIEFQEEMTSSIGEYHGKNRNVNLRDSLSEGDLTDLIETVQSEAAKYGYQL
jgi:Sulfotransferase family